MSENRGLEKKKKTSTGNNKISPANHDEKFSYFTSYKTPQSLIVSPVFERLNEPLGISNNDFLDTTGRGLSKKPNTGLGESGVATRLDLQSRQRFSRGTRGVRQGRWISGSLKESSKEVLRVKCQLMIILSFVSLFSIASLLLTILLIFGKVRGHVEKIEGMCLSISGSNIVFIL
jgi:hypothetical protein